MKQGDNDVVSADEEQAAIDALRRKDIGGLQALVRLHQTRAVRTAFLIVGNRDVAEDLVAEAFVKVYISALIAMTRDAHSPRGFIAWW